MPRSEAQLARVREESRSRIVASALELFAEEGYVATPVRRIAEHAGVAQGLLYNYFDGKDALLRAIFERSMADVQRSFEAASLSTDPGERIAELIRSAFAGVRSNLSFWRLSYQLRFQSGVQDSLGTQVREWSELIVRHLEAQLRRAGVPRARIEARVLFAAIDGAAQHYALDPVHYPLGRVAASLIARFVPGTEAGARRGGKEASQ